MKKLLLLFAAVFALAVGAAAQSHTVSGTVLSDEDGEPLVGATVLPVGGGTGTATNIDGQFTLSIPASVKELKVSYVGMHTATVPVSNGMTVKLVNSTNRLDEVMVVAYGTAKRSEYTGSASVVGAEQLQDALVSTATDALSGKVAGVQTQSFNGQPGSAPKVLIRGVGSINASTQPLYVVDGLPYEGDINLLNPQDIESMTVLKDAASTALYGARGANGVILVTTKKGDSDKVKITFDARWGANHRLTSDYDVITDTDQYMKLVGQALYNYAFYNRGASEEVALRYANSNLWGYNGDDPVGIGYQIYTVPDGESFFINNRFDINPNAHLGYSDGEYYYTPDDWNKGTYRNGFRQEYNVSISAATDKINYYLSGSYLSDDGIIQNSDFKRLSTRAIVDYKFNNWLKVGTNLAYVYTNSSIPRDQTKEDASTSAGNAFFITNSLGPVYPMYVRDAAGNIMYDPVRNLPIYDFGSPGYGYTNQTRNYMNGANPMSGLNYDKREYLTDFFQGKWYASLTPIEGLNVTGTIGYSLDNTRRNMILNGLYGQFREINGQVQNYWMRTRALNIQALASYQRTFNNVHNMSILAGYESLDWRHDNLVGQGENMYFPDVQFVSNTIDNYYTSGMQYSYATRGILVNAKYNYDSKYFFMGSYRRDASSRFAKKHRWGSFWSVSGAWDISKEKFAQDWTWLDMLKFKASFGQNGNDNLGNDNLGYWYAYADMYNVTGGNGVWNDAALYYKGNPDISWETSNNFNIGFDFSFFNGRIDGSIEYFNRQTSDMLYFMPTSPSLGYAEIPMNVGSMRNNGLEIDLNGTLFKNKDVQWDINANITFAGNKILKLHPDLNGEWINGSRLYREGESMYQLYMVKYAGVNPDNGEAQYWALDENGVEYKTASATDAYITNRVGSGNLMPKGYGGFGTSVKAYGFDFSIQFAYQFGGRLLDYTYYDFMHCGKTRSLGMAMHKDLLNAWTPDNRDTDVPRMDTGDQFAQGYAATDRWLISSNFLSLNNITLGYSFKKNLIEKLGLEELRIYGAAENVALWSKRKGLDPRQSYVSSENSTYSPARVISGGLRITF